jgi:hypothetical protein
MTFPRTEREKLIMARIVMSGLLKEILTEIKQLQDVSAEEGELDTGDVLEVMARVLIDITEVLKEHGKDKDFTESAEEAREVLSGRMSE